MIIVCLLARLFQRSMWGQHKATLAAAGNCAFLSSVYKALSVTTIPFIKFW